MLKKGTAVKGIYNGNIYIVDKSLGGGGVANVFLVHDINNYKFALKICDNLISITKEHKMLNMLKNYNFVPTVFDLDDIILYNTLYHYIVIEYIEGYDLGRLIKSGVSAENAAFICADVTNMLLSLKRVGIYYTDLKPSNIMMDERNKRLVLIDYGSTVKGNEGIKEFTPDFDRASWSMGFRKADSGYLSFEVGMLFIYLVMGKIVRHDMYSIAQILRNSKKRLGNYYIVIMKALNGTYDLNRLYINLKNCCFNEKVSFILNNMLFASGVIFLILLIVAL
ncbi:AarF/UbiB family protein [Thermoanaerobacterium sp. RBIITD]|uniref:protein kinase domain-containing protein n=1 Tax=Thermoanaerobacterium sp. RBIITD TaxID=1550240 RepID=UPI000BB7E6EB|nr:AarF/UbiB family protein [Thermoanaerobacterium sp. RBIITD]SNX54288.1 serine/threonine protein kinase [Thermoanaerobacterium sp. RBIITD]